MRQYWLYNKYPIHRWDSTDCATDCPTDCATSIPSIDEAVIIVQQVSNPKMDSGYCATDCPKMRRQWLLSPIVRKSWRLIWGRTSARRASNIISKYGEINLSTTFAFWLVTHCAISQWPSLECSPTVCNTVWPLNSIVRESRTQCVGKSTKQSVTKCDHWIAEWGQIHQISVASVEQKPTALLEFTKELNRVSIIHLHNVLSIDYRTEACNYS